MRAPASSARCRYNAAGTRLLQPVRYPMAYITDLQHFLTKDGRIAPTKGPAKKLAEFLTLVVALATAPSSSESPASLVACMGEPGKKRCGGSIRARVGSDTYAVHWRCPVCGNQGVISNWRGTLWDRSADIVAH